VVLAVDIFQRVEEWAVVGKAVICSSVVVPVVPRRLEGLVGDIKTVSANCTNLSMEGAAIFSDGTAVAWIVSYSIRHTRAVVKSTALSFSKVEGLSERVVDLVPAGTFEHSKSELRDSHVFLS